MIGIKNKQGNIIFTHKGADLSSSDLSGADLCSANLPRNNVIINDRYHIHIRKDVIKIGCESHGIDFWETLSVESAEKLGVGAGEWWNQWKIIILNIHNSF